MLLRREREELVSYGRRLRADGLAIGTSGNLSVRSADRVLITPSGIPYEEMGPGSVCVLGLDGAVVEAEAEPSTERPLRAEARTLRDAWLGQARRVLEPKRFRPGPAPKGRARGAREDDHSCRKASMGFKRAALSAGK